MLLIALSLTLSSPTLAGEGGDEGNCADEIDNDGDELTDCEDDECADDADCADEPTEDSETDCSDEVDNDGDDLIDCEDDDCSGESACEEEEEEETLCDTASGDTDCSQSTGSSAADLAGEVGGCGCTSTPAQGSATAMGLLLLGMLVSLRRRGSAPTA